MSAENGSTPGASGTAPISATRACGIANGSTDADAGGVADPITNTHNGSSEHSPRAAGPVTTPRDTTADPDSTESAHATHGEAIIAPAPNATANAPTRPTYVPQFTADIPLAARAAGTTPSAFPAIPAPGCPQSRQNRLLHFSRRPISSYRISAATRAPPACVGELCNQRYTTANAVGSV
ncbi:hypothetical protein TUM20983_55400 [Mycobacterium antarcticum]|nr:hypothetical protein TUM20983_55400 [Mycolicibacterium sp. TUM20983]